MKQDKDNFDNEEKLKLDSSFQMTFRTTHTNLEKIQVAKTPSSNAWRNPGPSAVAQTAVADATTHPPGGWHAPHHPWLLGSHGGKKKPLAVHLRTTPSTIPQDDSSSFKSQPSIEVLRKITVSIREEINPVKRDALSPQDISSRTNESDEENRSLTSGSSQEDSISYSIPDRALQVDEDEPLFAPTVEVSQASVSARTNATTPEESAVSDEAEERLHAAMEASSSPKWTPPGLKKTPVVGHKRPDPELLAPRNEKVTGEPEKGLEANNIKELVKEHAPEPGSEEGHSTAILDLPLGTPSQDKPWIQDGEIGKQTPHDQTSNTRPERPLMRALSPVQPLPEHSLPKESSDDIPLLDDFPATVHGINVAPTPSSMPPARLLSGPVGAVSSPVWEQHSASASSNDDNEAPKKVRKLSSYIDKQIASSRADGTTTDNIAETTTRDQEPKAPPVKLIAFVAVAVVVVLVGTTVTGWMIATSGVNWLSKSSTFDWKQLSQQADVAISNKSWSEAIDYLTKAISENPNLASLYHKRGLARLQIHEPQSGQLALADFDAAITKKSDLSEAYLDRAAAHIALGQYRQAIDDYDRLIKSGKDTSKVRFGLALAKYYSGEYSEAESGLRKILEGSPGNPEVVIALGTTIYKGQKNEIAAVNQYLSAQGPMKDSSGLALRNLAILAFEKGPSYYNEARKYYGDAIDISPGDANLFNERGILRWYQKEPIGAINDFKSALRREPDLSSAQDNLNFACNELIQSGRQKMKDQPKSHVGYALVAFGLSKLDRFKDALYYANEAIALNPRNAGSYEVLGTCYKELGLYEDAIAPLSVAISVSTTSGEAYGDRAYANYRSDHYPEALSDAEKAIQIDNTLTTPYTVRSVVLLSRGDYETALADNNRLVTLQPMNASNYSNRALTYIEGKRVKEAELDLRKSIALNPNHWHGFICLGSLMLDLGNHDEALNLLNKAVTIKPGQETYPTRIFYFEAIRQLDNAISDCSTLLTANPYNAGNFRLRGTAYSLAGNFVEAQKDFDSALKLKEDDEGYSDRAASYLRQGELDKADQDVRKALTLNRNSAPALTRQALSSILQKDWNGAVMSADKIVKSKGWEDSNSYAAVLLEWVALSYQGKTKLAREVLLNCKNNAENFPWPTPVVRFLLGEINFEQLKNESKNLGELTVAFYYGGMKDYFAGKKSEAKEKLRWVKSDGLMLNSEYLLAEKALDWMGAEGQTK